MVLRTALVSAALVISVPLPTPAHDIYTHLRDEREAPVAVMTRIAALRSIA
jgi:hypothetical protein